MPTHHDVRAENVDPKRLGAVLAVAYDREVHDFASLLLLEKLGPGTLQSLALVAEVVHTERPRDFQIQHVFPSLSPARMATHFPCLSKPTTKPYTC